MANKKQPEVVVIGAGILGSSIAFHLSERGARVTVLDRGKAGEGATRASFAWINARDKTPRTYHELNRRSLDAWPRFARRLGPDAEPVWGGELRWASSERRVEQLRKWVQRLQSWGYGIREITPAEISTMEPEIYTGKCVLGSYSAMDGHVNAPAVVGACLASIKERGGSVETDTRVTGFLKTGKEVRAVVVQSREIKCDAVVVACGPDETEVASLAGIKVPVHHTVEPTALTVPVEPIFKQIAVLHTPREDAPPVFVRQLPDGRVMINGTHGDSPSNSSGPSDEYVGREFEQAIRYVPTLKGTGIEEIRRARKPIPEDGQTILGFSEATPNLYVAASHSGVTLAPLIGELATVEIIDSADVGFLKPFRPSRFE